MERSGRHLIIPDSESLSAQPSPVAEEVAGSLLASRQPRVGFVDLLDFGFQWGIPYVELSRLGVQRETGENQRLAYSLGIGHTATVIRHEADDEMLKIVAKGTSVALKSFSEKPPSYPAWPQQTVHSTSRTDTYRAVHRELGVLCHPGLSEHPNIVKLLFLGWQKQSPFPVLGLELGEYGSLDYVLRATGAGLSKRQKIHISLDIALGLNALHQNDLVHGDLKPSNIVVLEHSDPQRPIIAKLTDFGGASQTGTGHAPEFVTRLWCAPEVINDDPDIEWKNSDVYSVGLILASMWSRPEEYIRERPESSCILLAFVPEVLEDQDRENFLLLLKNKSSDRPGSVLNKTIASLPDGVPPNIRDILRKTLEANFWLRPSIFHVILEHLKPISLGLGRNLDEEMCFEPIKRRFNKADNNLFEVWSPWFRSRSREFQGYVRSQLENEVGNDPGLFDSMVEDIPETIDEDISAEKYLDLLFQGLRQMMPSLPGAASDALSSLGVTNEEPHLNITEKGRICYHIALCYILGIGTELSLAKGLPWLRAAVLGCHMPAVYVAPALYYHHSPPASPLGLERLLLGLGCLSRNPLCMDMLASRWPSHHRALLRLFRRKWRGGLFLDRRRKWPEPAYFFSTLMCSPSFDESLIASILSYNLESVQQLLEVGVDASIVSDDGISALHALTYLRDDDASDLARALVEKGADLQSSLSLSSDSIIGLGHVRRGSPLLCAMLCEQVKFAKTLIFLHMEYAVPIEDFDRVLVYAVISWYHELVGILLDILWGEPSLCDTLLPLTDAADGSSSLHFFPTQLLDFAMGANDLTSLENRINHRLSYDEAYAKTIELLIERGADPTKGVFKACPLYRCLCNDDAVALRCFIQFLYERYDGEPLHRMIDPGHMREQSWTASENTGLQICIYNKSAQCFDMLLENFPPLVEEENARGLTALHSATYHADNIAFLRALLEHGSDVLAVSKDNSTTLHRALRNKNIKGADLITQYCSSEELETILSQPVNRYSLFARLIYTWHLDRDPGLLDSFRWIIAHGGSHFFAYSRTVNGSTMQIPIWNDLLARVRPPDKVWQFWDLSLATLLFDTFPEQINVTQPDSRGVLHVAVWYGHVKIVRLLIQRGVNVNLEISPGPENLQGQTALNLAIVRSKSHAIPEEVQVGGTIEITRWKNDLAAITRLLYEAGGRSGSGAAFHQGLEVFALHEFNCTVVNSMNEPEALETDDIWKGAWPHALPRDVSSVPEPDMALEQRLKLLRRILASSRDMFKHRRRADMEYALGEGYRNQLRIQAQEARLMWRLPESWEVRKVEGSDKFYFFDHNTKTTTGTKPPLIRGLPGL